MNHYLDDNSADPVLAALLRRAGNVVVSPSDVDLAGASDARHLEHAIRSGLVVVTADRDDFLELHELVLTSGGSHPGILVVSYENDPRRDMKPRHVVGAVSKLERSGAATIAQVIVLNQWR